jgi:hypothetical protein
MNDEIERLKRLLEEARTVRDSNRRLAEFAMTTSDEHKARARFFEVSAGELYTGFQRLLTDLLAANPTLYHALTQPIEDYLPTRFPVYRGRN